MKTKRPKIAHFIVLKQGQPCSLMRLLTGKRDTVLLPLPAGAQAFRRRRAVNSALERTAKIRALLEGSMHRDWLADKEAQVKELLTPGEYTVVPVLEAKPEAKP